MAPIEPAPLPPSTESDEDVVVEGQEVAAPTPAEETPVDNPLSNVNDHSPPADSPVTRSDVIRALRKTRGQAANNAKKTRMAFDTTQAAADSGALKTQRFKK